ncbi:hypothetical protein R8Z50_19490 [Longispora sp. K20-0274]|uniref:hypothetical protein n=1 Tax=Longispora sp. K20-0274 TaxID=3088255 RepID=UPI00399A924D
MSKLRTWAVAGMTAVAGLTLAASQAGTASAAPGTQWTATQIADGLLFHDGPVARALHRAPVALTTDQRDNKVRIDRAIAADPAWSATFVREMRSGDPRQVNQGLTDLAVVAGVTRTAPTQQTSTSYNFNGPRLVHADDMSWYKAANIGMQYVGDIGLDIGGMYTPTVPGRTGLQREMLVADIARGLRAGQ